MLAFGRKTPITGTDLALNLIEVPEDSRCPRDVVCIWAGPATAVLRVELDGQETKETETKETETKETETKESSKVALSTAGTGAGSTGGGAAGTSALRLHSRQSSQHLKQGGKILVGQPHAPGCGQPFVAQRRGGQRDCQFSAQFQGQLQILLHHVHVE